MNVRTRTLLLSAAISFAAALGACASDPPQPASPAQALEEQRARAHAHILKAEEYVARGQIEDAISLYKQAVLLDSRRFDAWYNLGALCNQQRRFPEAVEAWRYAADLEPADPRAYTALGLQYQDLGFLSDAAACYGRALERDPNYLPALKKSIEVDQLTDSYSDVTLARLRRAIPQETDAKWGEYLQRMLLKTQERVSRAGGSTGH
ncbi:MAG TPA: tetratricopeptide repeat protein [Phycisphaerales bacterium]|nr:tetratricopeptide repeat protein [Phycisphaerales bacterium]